MVHIDGAHAEGGGQILRTALALSALTGTPFHAERIRENRPRPGLKPQHLSGIQALARMRRGRAEGQRPVPPRSPSTPAGCGAGPT